MPELLNDGVQTWEEARIEIDLRLYGLRPEDPTLYSELKPQAVEPNTQIQVFPPVSLDSPLKSAA